MTSRGPRAARTGSHLPGPDEVLVGRQGGACGRQQCRARTRRAARPCAESRGRDGHVIVSPGHRLASTSAGLPDLAGEKFVDLPEGGATRPTVVQAFAEAGVERVVQIEARSFAEAVDMVVRGLGLAFMPASALEPEDKIVLWSEGFPLLWRMQLGWSAARPPTGATLDIIRAFQNAAGRGGTA